VTVATRTFASLRVRNFRLYIIGQLLSTMGFWMAAIATPWLILNLTDSGSAVGIAYGLTFLPTLLFGVWGGLLADRFDNRKLLIAAEIGFMVASLLLWFVVETGVVEVWMVYVLSLVAGVAGAVDFPARQSFYLEMVGRDQLTNAMSLNTATFTGSRIVGAGLGGALIAAFGTAPVFLIDGLTYGAVIVALLLMRRDELHLRERVPRERGQIRDGISYVWRTPDLRFSILLMLVVFLFAFNVTVLVPLLVRREFGAESAGFGGLMALWGAGSLAGALFMASRATAPHPRRLAVLAIGVGLVMAAIAAAPALWAAAALMPALGAVFISFAITGNSTLQLTSEGSFRGRVMALYTVVFLGSTPIGGPIMGWVGEHLGVRFGFVTAAGVAIAAGAVGLGVLAGRAPARAEASSPP
jgi:MFS family permease